MGHTHCGRIKASTSEKKYLGLIQQWLLQIKNTTFQNIDEILNENHDKDD